MVAVKSYVRQQLLAATKQNFQKQKPPPCFTLTHEKDTFAREWVGSEVALSSTLSSDCSGHLSSPDVSSITYEKSSDPFHLQFIVFLYCQIVKILRKGQEPTRVLTTLGVLQPATEKGHWQEVEMSQEKQKKHSGTQLSSTVRNVNIFHVSSCPSYTSSSVIRSQSKVMQQVTKLLSAHIPLESSKLSRMVELLFPHLGAETG